MATKLQGGSNTAGLANVNSTYELQVALNTDAELAGSVRMFSENDPGTITGTPYVYSPETDEDFRLRAAFDTSLDNELFNYTAQNTGKYQLASTSFVSTFSASGFAINTSNLTTTGAFMGLQSRAYFSLIAPGVLYIESAFSIGANIPTNAILDMGYFVPNNAATPLDGVYFSFRNGSVVGVVNVGGVEETVALSFVPDVNTTVRAIATIHKEEVHFWVNNVLYGSLAVSAANSQPFRGMTNPFCFSYRHTGTAGAAVQVTLKEYNVSLGGVMTIDTLATIGNRILGSYQGLSGGTMGSLANYTNSSNPTAAVPTNTTAALGSGLGGQFWETDTLAVNTDGIIQSYQVPTPTTAIQGRRLVITGVKIDSFVQTVLTLGGYVAQWSLAFGHTVVAINASEAPTTKASRRIPLGLQAVAATAAAGTVLSTVQMQFQNPIYVNPGEFVACVKKKVGTVPGSGVIAHIVSFDYGWE